MTTVHPIEAASYRILAERVDLTHLEPLCRAVVARVIHASADLEFATSMVVDEVSLSRAVEALRGGGPIITDVEMVRSGITDPNARCFLAQASATADLTRSAGGIRIAARHHPQGAIFVVGCAPTALTELVELAASGDLEPALVIGMPVGFVGAAESKAALRASGMPSISNVGEKGGSAVAAAAANALIRATGDPNA
ncbi:MAG: precorrin-8X methylmutase [Acidimicrobiales bacterium]